MTWTLLARSAWLLLLSFAASAWAGPKAYVGNFKDSTVSVVDLDRAAVLGVIPVAAGPHGMVLSPDERRLYVSGDGSAQVSVIDTASDRVLNTLAVGPTPHGLAIAADGRQLLVAGYGDDRVEVIDTASGQRVASVPVARPHTIAVRPDGQRAYVSSQAPGHFALVIIDLQAMKAVGELPLDKPPRDLEFAFDGRALYFTVAGENAVQVLDPRTDRVVAAMPTGVSPHVAKLFRGAAAGVVVVQGPGELALFDATRNAVTRTVAVGRQPHWVAAPADGRTAAVTNEGSDELSIVDLASGQVRSVAVGHAPRKVVVVSAAPVAAASAGVSIANFAYTPQELVIEPGQTVTWRNDDGAPHGLAFQDGAPGADLLLPGASFSRRFDRPGSYAYACTAHPYMTGRIVVRPRS